MQTHKSHFLIDTAVNSYGSLDILVNNAGIMDNFEAAADIQDEAWEKIFAINTLTGRYRIKTRHLNYILN
ncbi:SDR family NAD(P)-dependent oxidoreductase [Alkalihalobacillus oceani]|nr:SDR family NAD(P)-dependent oxidoreductase [Halalkalibacter oceani]MCM3759889.1 SDR family NAD(P)-dependent oxidoreductase [Halalkalibacter oceani]